MNGWLAVVLCTLIICITVAAIAWTVRLYDASRALAAGGEG